MSDTNVIDFFSRVPKEYRRLLCLFCLTKQNRVIPKTKLANIYYDCPGCDEIAAAPEPPPFYGKI